MPQFLEVTIYSLVTWAAPGAQGSARSSKQRIQVLTFSSSNVHGSLAYGKFWKYSVSSHVVSVWSLFQGWVEGWILNKPPFVAAVACDEH